MLSTGADTVTFSLVGFVLFVAVVVVWRVVVHDRQIRRVRFGVFYERERDEGLEDEGPHHSRHERLAKREERNDAERKP